MAVDKQPPAGDFVTPDTCAASKSVGKSYGVFKYARLKPVKTDTSTAGLLEGFQLVRDDVAKYGRQGKAIVFSHWEFRRSDARTMMTWQVVERFLQDLYKESVLVITAAADSAWRSQAVDSLPALFGLQKELPVITSGAVNRRGRRIGWSQRLSADGRDLTIWAPGEQVRCHPGQSLPYATGTAYAAGMVSAYRYSSNTATVLLKPLGRWTRCLFPEHQGRCFSPWPRIYTCTKRLPTQSRVTTTVSLGRSAYDMEWAGL